MPASSQPHEVFFYKESTPGTGQANAAAYVADEGTDTFRHYVAEKVDPGFIEEGTIVDPRNVSSHYQTYASIKGLRSVEGGSMMITAAGSGSAVANGSQIDETGLMEILRNALGGLHRSNTTGLTAVTNDTTFELTANTNYAAGQLLAFEDDDDTDNLLHVRQLLTLSGSDGTTQADLPFVLGTSDTVHALATLYPDADILEDPDNANHLTHTVGIDRNGKVHLVHGCSFDFNAFSWDRSDVAKFGFGIMGGSISPPGDGGFDSSPAWTGTVQGNAGIVIGCSAELVLQARGNTTAVYRQPIEFSFTPGVPRVALPVTTSINAGMCAIRGHGAGTADTEVQIRFYSDDEESSNEFQNAWDNATEYYATMYLKTTAGKTIAVHCQRLVPSKPPTHSNGDVATEITTFWRARELDSGTAMAKAKFHVGIG